VTTFDFKSVKAVTHNAGNLVLIFGLFTAFILS